MSEFDHKARDWDQNTQYQERAAAVAASLVERVPLRPGLRALEFGAGTGLLSFALASHFREIVMMDSSSEMVRVMEEKVAEGHFSHLIPHFGELTVRSFPPESFDLIYNLMVMHHVEDIPGILRLFHELLRPGGWLVLADLYSEDGTFHSKGFHGHKGFDPQELRRELEAAGFEFREVRPCYVTRKEKEGVIREYPVFMMTARRPEAVDEGRRDALATFSRRLVSGESGKTLYEEYRSTIETVTPFEAMMLLDGLLKEGHSFGTVKYYTARLLNLFYKSLAAWPCELPGEGHFLHYLAQENREAEKIMSDIKKVAKQYLSQGSRGLHPERGSGVNREAADSAGNRLGPGAVSGSAQADAAVSGSPAGPLPENISPGSNSPEELINLELLTLLNRLDDYTIHYVKKENILFPWLEKVHPEPGCLQIMWSLHDDFRRTLRSLKKMLREGTPGREQLSPLLGNLFFVVLPVIFREEHILFPVALSVIPRKAWDDMLEESLDTGWCYGVTPVLPQREEPVGTTTISERNLLHQGGAFPGDSIVSTGPVQDVSGRTIPVPPGGSDLSVSFAAHLPGSFSGAGSSLIDLGTGLLTPEQLVLMLNHMPIDVTLVNEHDVVLYFSGGQHRIFPRSKAIIGRKVQNCHPPESVHMVEEILAAFRNGEKDQAAFWIQSRGKFIHICYFALRDETGNYRGTLEFSQDITEIKKLEGEKRLLDWEK